MQDNIKSQLTDNNAIMIVLGNLLLDPSLLISKKINLSPDDFPEQFHRILFGAIEYLSNQGYNSINAIDIDQFLIKFEIQYKVFCDNQGLNYVDNLLKIIKDSSRFENGYNTVKKFSVLRQLVDNGIDIRDVYDLTILDPTDKEKMRSKFLKYSVKDILDKFEIKLIEISNKFVQDKGNDECQIGDGLQELKESYKKIPLMGMPFPSPILTTVLSGKRKGCLYINSSDSGGGKTRSMIGEACLLSVGHYYDKMTNQWKHTGFHEPILFISKELLKDELQSCALANISGVDEMQIVSGEYTKEEEQRLDKAIKYLEKAQIYLVRTPFFDIEDIEKIIKFHYIKYQTQFVWFDYVCSNAKLLGSMSSTTGIKNAREEMILMMLSASLKDMAQRYNICISTATQLSRNDGKKGYNADMIRGARSIVDACDCGYLTLPISTEDEDIINSYKGQKEFLVEPNRKIILYKIRRSKYVNFCIYQYFNFDTASVYDCFATNWKGEIVNIKGKEIEFLLKEIEDKETNKEEFIKRFDDNGNFIL